MQFVLYGYPGNVWTERAEKALKAHCLDFVYEQAPAGVNWDNPDLRFRRMPTLVFRMEDREAVLASGIDAIEGSFVESEAEREGFRRYALANGFTEEEIECVLARSSSRK